MMEESQMDKYLQNQKKLCESLFNEYIRGNLTKRGCPPSFDGILCWPRQIAGSVASLLCPPQFILGYMGPTNASATKICLEDAQWYRNEKSDQWTNYTLCTPPPGHYVTAITDLKNTHFEYEETINSTVFRKWVPIVKSISRIGYATSLTTLVIAMIIFSFLRKLRNPRNRLHMHLFASFIMRALMTLLKDLLFVDGIGLTWDVVRVDGTNAFIKERNMWVCKAIISLWQFSIVANYAWILMEGLYLHNLVFLALCADTSAITTYILLGWGIPAIVVSIWILVRIIMEDTLCWTTHNNPSVFFIIQIPIVVSILFNFVLFINIVRVLLVKMKTSVYLQRKKMQYGRWAKSTLVLVPLFGAHYTLFLGLEYHKDDRVELIGLFGDQLFASFQGAFVAFLYCLLNGEVRAEIRRAWKARSSRHSRNRRRTIKTSLELGSRKIEIGLISGRQNGCEANAGTNVSTL